MNEATISVGSANANANATLPRPIRRVLGRLGSRLRIASSLGGLGTTVLVVSLFAALGMAADLARALPQLARWVIWGVWLALGGIVLIRTTLLPLVRRFGTFDLAAVAERGQPELAERLTGAVALLGSGRAPHGSPALIAALAREAVAESRTVKPARAVAWSRAARRCTRGLLAFGLLAAPAFLWPDSYGALARRFLMPWADIDRISRFVVTVAPGDKVLAVGSDLTITASVRPRFGVGPTPDSAWLEWTIEGETSPQRIAMPLATGPEPSNPSESSARRFAFTLPRLGQSIAYRVVSGEAASRRHRITTLEPPCVTSIAARVEPPSYTKLPTTMARDPARIDVFEGSRITLDITPSRPVHAIEVGWPKPSGTKPDLIAATLANGGRSGSVSLIAEASGPYTLALRDEHGLGNLPEPARRVIVRPDAPPVVTRWGLEDLKEASPDDALTVALAARDDIAVASIELHYAIRRAGSTGVELETGHVLVKAQDLGTRSARGLASLEFHPLGLKPGDSLNYRLRVADNRPAPRGPNVVWSSPEEITIVAGAEPMMAQLRRLRRSAVQEKLDALKKTAATNRQESERLRESAESVRDSKGRWDKTRQEAVERREADARAMMDQIQRFARDLDQDPRLHTLARPARQIAELEAESGRAMLDRARQDDDPERRAADLKQAANRLGAVGDRLEELQHKLNELSKDDSQSGRLQALAAREQELADEAETPGDRAQLDRLQARQNAVRSEIDTLVRQSPELRGALLQAETKEAERLAREARALSDRQHEESRRAADPSRNAPELKALAEAQRALEDDARRLALEVDQPLAENGRSRLNSEAIRQAADPIERGDIDQARQSLEGAENELRRLARDIEDVPADPKALAGRLVRRQYALNGEIDQSLQDVRNKEKLGAEEKAALNARMKSLARREETIARLAKTIKPPEGKEGRAKFPQEAAQEAVNKTRRAVETLGTLTPQVIEEGKNGARQALERLANELPDIWRRQEPTRKKFDEARRAMNELSGQIVQHLRETEPRPDKPATAARAAEELARRLNDAADRQTNAVTALKEMEPEPRAEPQRDRAVRRASALARTLKDLHDPSKREAARAALPIVEIQARAAMDRLEQKLNGRVPADDLAAELADDQHQVHEGLTHANGDDAAVERTAAAENQRRLANAMRNLNVPDATLVQIEAIRLADQAAQALTNANEKVDPVATVRVAADAASNLADRLADRQTPQAQAAALARAERALNEPDLRSDPAQSASRQKAIAAELARLPLEKKGEAARRIERAVELADRAAQIDDDRNGAGRPTADALTDSRNQAAEALDRLAAQPAKPAPAPKPARAEPPTTGDPELPLNSGHVATAKELVRRQRQLRERLQAVLGRHVEPQQAIRREAVALGGALSELRDHIRALSDRGSSQAFEAAHHLRAYAAQSMDQATEYLAQGQAPYARDAQRRASEMVDRGAQHAEDLAAALRAERQTTDARAADPARAPGDASAAEHPPIGEARSAILRAARQLDQARDPGQAVRAVPAAREAMREAARDLRSAAQAASQLANPPFAAEAMADGESSVPDPSDLASKSPAGSPLDPHSRPGSKAETDLTELKETIRRKTGRAWGELPSHLRTEILQASQGRYRDDYARLIQLYFREIAGAAADPKPESGAAK